MIKVDDRFLAEVGLQNLPEPQRTAFITEIQGELENRVGEKMSEGMTPEQLEEFDGIMQKDRNTMIKFLTKLGDYRQDDIYKNLLQKYNTTEGTLEILGEYLSVKWIQLNRPDYARVAQDIESEFKQEIIKAHDEIMEMVRQTSGTEEEVVARYNPQNSAPIQPSAPMQPVAQPTMQQPMSNIQQPAQNWGQKKNKVQRIDFIFLDSHYRRMWSPLVYAQQAAGDR